MISSGSEINTNRITNRTDAHGIIACRSKHFLISSCQSFHQKSNTNSVFSYRFPISGNLSFCLDARQSNAWGVGLALL